MENLKVRWHWFKVLITTPFIGYGTWWDKRTLMRHAFLMTFFYIPLIIEFPFKKTVVENYIGDDGKPKANIFRVPIIYKAIY